MGRGVRGGMSDPELPAQQVERAPVAEHLGRMPARSRTGEEPLRDGDQPLGFQLRDFWRWSLSDLLSNAARGIFAEFLVALALETPLDGVRDEWAPFDLTTPEGTTVEVKSAAYLQSWSQRRLSGIVFSTRPTRAWCAKTNTYAVEIARQAHVYVFALLAHQDKATVDPLDANQWRFFVLPTTTLNARTRSQHSITLPTLAKLTRELRFEDLRTAVRDAARSVAA